ncbi:hypothetical protein [Thalassovita mangrovi]|uniref:Uncharacterized protein n=1 Tax=Thalassovita mangrovi TaxID=2692236 RepID=A0A6L8LKB5_9RHOB|nr:hypothetical protein [Thalassovita mangrovi]MYM56093.1 hypothetical protein [Thalassovita mangrovi]
MNSDFVLVIGLAVAVFALASVVSAWSDHRPVVVSGLLLAIGAALTVYACALNDWQYQLRDVPMAFLNVIGMVMH